MNQVLVRGFVLGVIAALMLGSAGMTGERPAGERSAEEAGKKLFIRCVACHSLSAEDGRILAGPHLDGIVGRKVASVEGFKYSDAMRALSITWDEAELDRLLMKPQSIIPGLCMPFMGLAKAEDRAALIAFLKNPVD